jgi:lipopolysaccharide export system protein LptA
MAAATIVAAVAALAAAGAVAEKADRDKPINYSADVGDVNYQTKIGTLTGNVVVTQGTLTVHADKVVFRQNPDNSLSVTAYGNPVSFRQKRDGLDEYYEGFAQRAEYDGAKELLELFDRALLKRGTDEIRSNYISYNAATELFKAEGRESKGAPPEPGGPGARVRGVFQPRPDALPGKGAKDAGKGAPKAAPAGEAPAVTLKPAGELAPPAK